MYVIALCLIVFYIYLQEIDICLLKGQNVTLTFSNATKEVLERSSLGMLRSALSTYNKLMARLLKTSFIY